MRTLLSILTVALLNAGAYAEELNVTFGASSDLAAKYGEHDLTGNAKQNADIAAPHISIVAKFDVPVDASKLAAPIIVPVADKPAPKKSGRGDIATTPEAKTTTAPARPPKAVAPPKIETDSLLVPRLFCDNMILQQQAKNTFWGWAKPSETIVVKASWGAEASAKADAEGKWKLFLETPQHGTGHSLIISGEKDTINIENVAIGEVWLCVGQSNMGWSMGNSFEAEKEADVNLPDFRIFKSAREHWHTPLEMQRDRLSQWKPCTPASAAETSAVSYYFGKKLHQELGIPVGLIQQAYAGTPIEGWMPWEIQKDDPRTQTHKSELDERAATTGSREKALADFEQALAEYNAKIDAGETMKNGVRPLSPPIITKPADLGHQYPGHQFNAMICPIRPYGIRGVIWYQGERNSKDVPQAANYRKQLALLINYYRSSWHELSAGSVADDFPFQFTQLPSWTPEQTKPVEGLEAPWAVNRNKEGIPASPFRTDDWPLFDPDAEIVTVEKPAKPEVKNSIDWERPEMTQGG